MTLTLRRLLAFSASVLLTLPYAAASAPAPASVPRSAAQQEQVRSAEERLLPQMDKALRQQRGSKELSAKDAQSLESEPVDTGILSKLPTLEKLEKLDAQIRAEPTNLDHYFAYAQMASKLGEWAKAAEKYEAMLKLAPHLHRVRLDLAAAYLRLNRFEEARNELTNVLEHDPPPIVRENIEQIMTKVDSELKEHTFSGLLSAGLNFDSNANSAPRSDSIVIFDTPIPLGGDQLAQTDLQAFTVLGLNHSYHPRWAKDEQFSRRWNSSMNLFRSEQSSLETLDIQVLSLKTGPSFQSMQSGISVHPAISYSQIVLDEQTFLRSATAETRVDIPISERFSLSAEGRFERRHFENSTTVSTFEARTGNATQWQLSGRYMASENDVFNASLLHRRERTQREYFDNEQFSASLGYTRVLPWDSFANFSLGYRHSVFDDEDPLISQRTRRDEEKTVGLTLGHNLSESISLTAGYQYRRVNSNLPNYEFDNHRFSTSLGYRF